MKFLVSSNIDDSEGFRALDVDLPLNAENTKSACLQYLIECGLGEGKFVETVDIGTDNNPCIRYCIKNDKSKVFIYVMTQGC